MTSSGECKVSLSGKHQFNPKRFSKTGNGEPPYSTVYQCVCGRTAPDKKAVVAQLAETRKERARQREESKQLRGAKQMEANREEAKQAGLL